jgi:murein L,D-transpeptidase YafK
MAASNVLRFELADRLRVAIMAAMLRRWIAALFVVFIALVTAFAAPTKRADRVVVLKKERTLILYSNGTELKRYKVALGGNPVGPKSRQGDGRTPEGTYVLDFRNSKSQFYKSIHISYPNASDRERARKLGVSPGGDIFLHGLPNGYGAIGAAHRLRDWTNGCIAVTNQEIDEIWAMAPNGTVIEIKP